MTDQKNLELTTRDNKCLKSLLKRCNVYTKNECYVYKICRNISSKKDKNSGKWLVVMKKLKDTLTNEARSDVVDMNHAKFRANKLEVIKIFNKNSPKMIKRFVVNKYDDTKLRYIVGQIVESDGYDDDIDKVCSNGVHYFKTLEAAYYYGDMQKNYTGYMTRWHDNGQKAEEGNYVDGQESGIWTYWHENGQKLEEGNYVNGMKSGHKLKEGEYVEGKKSGHWTYWRINGQKYEGDYVNGKKSGHWEFGITAMVNNVSIL